MSVKRVFDYMDMCTPTAPLLVPLDWRQGDEEDDWAEKAIKSLYDKLKKKERSGDIQELINALLHPGQSSKCVMFPVGVDGRQQVGFRKLPPHVIFCRVLRWVDLQTHQELRQLCKKTEKDQVCINPCHYERFQPPALATVVVPRGMHSPLYAMLPVRQSQGSSVMQASYVPDVQLCRVTQDPSSLGCAMQRDLRWPEVLPIDYSKGSSRTSNTRSSVPSYHNMGMLSYQGVGVPACCAIPAPTHSFVSGNSQYWCTIQYNELEVPIGEPFHGQALYGFTPYCCGEVIIDGFTDPSVNGNRFSVGRLSNPKRSNSVKETRNNIGKGVRVYYENGKVYVECVSLSPIFIHSIESNLRHNFCTTTIVKLTYGKKHNVFDDGVFVGHLFAAASPVDQNVVDELLKLCSFRISFFNGWGAESGCKDVTSMPCWVHINLAHPLKCLDQMLTTMTPAISVIPSSQS